MIEFSQLQLVEAEPIRYESILMSKRYIIGSDPFLQNGSLKNVFTIYDKATMSVTLKIKTKKSFNEFVEDITKKNNNDIRTWKLSKREYNLSHKFITNDGAAVRVTRTDY